MTQQWTFYILLSTFLLNSPTNGAEDLLDQYVKHVENVNRITLEPHVNLGHKKVIPLRTSYYRRSLKSVQDSGERTNEQDVPTALKSNETDSAVLARDHRDELEIQHAKNKTHKHKNGHSKGSKQESKTADEHQVTVPTTLSSSHTDRFALAHRHNEGLDGQQARNGTHKHKNGSKKSKQEFVMTNEQQSISMTSTNGTRSISAQTTPHNHKKGTKQKAKRKDKQKIQDESRLIPMRFDDADNMNKKQGRKHQKLGAKNMPTERHQPAPTYLSLDIQNSSVLMPKPHNHKKGLKNKTKSKDPSNDDQFDYKATTLDPSKSQSTEKPPRKHKKMSGQKHQPNRVNVSDTLLPSILPSQKHRGGSKQRGKHSRKHDSRRRSRSRRSVLKEDLSDRERRDVTSDILWTHSETLDKGGLVVLKWQPRHQEILFRVEARTRGYVAIGFSPDGKMENADMVMGWVDDRRNQPFLLDCHGVPKSQGNAPVKDEIDNYTLMRGIQNGTHTIIEFRRVLDTCDPHDYVLSGDTVRVIWALHDSDPPRGAEMVYHEDKRGSQSIHLMAPPPVPKMPAGHYRHWDIAFENLKIPSTSPTSYWCKVFKPPTLARKHHIVGFEPIMPDKRSSGAYAAHHMIVHECQLDDDEDIMVWEEYANEKGRQCFVDMPVKWEKCLTPLVAWAIGSKGENFPHHVGLPLAGSKRSYYMVEAHFDNPTGNTLTGTWGLRLHYTGELRKNEGGMMMAGVVPSTLHFVPPFQKEYRTAGYCSIGCTREIIPKSGINIVSVMLHSHLAARKLKLRHIRGDKELSPLAEDGRYDFNYQQSRRLSQDIPVLPGDGFITECTYNTEDRSAPTVGGYSTKEEMCLAFILHYPRTELAGCYSMPPVKYFFEALGIREFYGKDMVDIEKAFLEGSVETESLPTTTPKLFDTKPGDELSPEANQKAILALQQAKDYSIVGQITSPKRIFDRLVIKEPQEFRNMSLSQHLHRMPYNDSSFTSKMEEYFYKGLHLTFCRKRDDSLAIKEHIESLPNFQEYENRPGVVCSHKARSQFGLQSSSSSHPILARTIYHIVTMLTIYRILS